MLLLSSGQCLFAALLAIPGPWVQSFLNQGSSAFAAAPSHQEHRGLLPSAAELQGSSCCKPGLEWHWLFELDQRMPERCPQTNQATCCPTFPTARGAGMSRRQVTPWHEAKVCQCSNHLYPARLCKSRFNLDELAVSPQASAPAHLQCLQSRVKLPATAKQGHMRTKLMLSCISMHP